jgi:exonuclease-1
MDHNGNGELIQLDDLGAVPEPNFGGFTQDMFRHICMLSGCDYLPNIPGLGLKTAHALMLRHRDVNKVLLFNFQLER